MEKLFTGPQIKRGCIDCIYNVPSNIGKLTGDITVFSCALGWNVTHEKWHTKHADTKLKTGKFTCPQCCVTKFDEVDKLVDLDKTPAHSKHEFDYLKDNDDEKDD